MQTATANGSAAGTHARGGRRLQLGDEHYLWALVALELAALALLRHQFRNSHGG